MSRRCAIEKAAREERLSKIRHCRKRDPNGWLLDTDGTPVDPARRCIHGARRPAGRDITEPIHQADLFDTQEPQP
jgi:LDH2 family malate/lactate/ureidoglycolate dehydrogenase